jgi:hypothetical protein
LKEVAPQIHAVEHARFGRIQIKRQIDGVDEKGGG